ncbi:MAG: cache domain-containing protein [Pseudomonadota bacterium]
MERAKWKTWGVPLSYGQKVFLVATIPLIFAVAAIALVVQAQSRQLSERELATLERELLEAKEEELKNYIALARQAFVNIYGRAGPDDETAKLLVTQTLAAMTFGSDGFFFVYDYDGNNLVSPRQTYLIGENWVGLTDSAGTPVVDRLIEIAKNGSGYHRYLWPKPSTGENAEMVSYVIGLQDWRWAVGTGIFIDDVLKELSAARMETQTRIRNTSLWILAITAMALILVFLSGLLINIRERRLADVKLKELTQRIFDTQEEERTRVSRELHDGISQTLVGIRYALDLAARQLGLGEAKAQQSIERSRDGLNTAIGEVRRISRDLRPGILDDLGLSPALKELVDDFSRRTNIATEFETVVFRNRLEDDAKTALYRVAQEALTNIERHAKATKVKIDVYGHKRGATLKIADNGVGFDPDQEKSGLGLRNMQERIEHLSGRLLIKSTKSGTHIEATLPLSNMLKAEQVTPSGESQ